MDRITRAFNETLQGIARWWQGVFPKVTHQEAGVKLEQQSPVMGSITMTLTAEQSKKTAVTVKPAAKKTPTKRKTASKKTK